MSEKATFGQIEAQWKQWEDRAFPSAASSVEIDGVDLVSVDTFAAGCISVFVGNRGKLDQERVDILRKCTHDLDAVLAELQGESERYFNELSRLSHAVLEFMK